MGMCRNVCQIYQIAACLACIYYLHVFTCMLNFLYVIISSHIGSIVARVNLLVQYGDGCELDEAPLDGDDH